ncbi:lipoprotein-releasing ABC transporter permease subunit [Caulobacter mirabilis]|uniref:Lipoprotein-releasing system transmembrane subunit LolC n=1 Tax=Caulobacter mirabilis TaxID=69666 RepID=A0A2D2AYF5_9CAUL|nr:lipoprotein-releasing ABC transporter permease subunit [Caulobacter mirabilis]ATQ43049.1 lipoprotein-releasing system transmembrane subunit LolC [Caulobacter mirabilis]
MSQAAATHGAPFGRWERAVAVRYLRARRKDAGVALMSVICFLAIMLAVFAQITVMSVMNGFRADLLDRMLGFNGHAYVLGDGLYGEEPAHIVERLLKVPQVTRATPMVEGQAMVMGPAQISGAMVRGISPSDLRKTDIIAKNIRRGSLDGFGQGEYGGDLILIGDRMAASLGVGPGDPITLISPSGASTAFGQSVSQKDYVIGGVFSVGMSEFDQLFIYMPLEQAQLFFGREGRVDKIEIMVKNPDKATSLRPALKAAAGPLVSVADWTQQNRSFFEALAVERVMVRLIMMVVVIMAALNIISCVVMMVKNKGRDIGILRTMGASQGAVLRIFMMAGVILGLAGSAVGLVLGVVFCANIEAIQQIVESVTGTQVFNADVYFLSHLPAKIEWHEVAIATGWSFAMSILATLWPAWRASRLDPVEALRYE